MPSYVFFAKWLAHQRKKCCSRILMSGASCQAALHGCLPAEKILVLPEFRSAGFWAGLSGFFTRQRLAARWATSNTPETNPLREAAVCFAATLLVSTKRNRRGISCFQ